MAYKQLVTPDLDPFVYVNGAVLNDWYGWCLATVECAYNSPRLYPNAWAGWLDAKAKHQDRSFPVGVYFPIWFSGYGGLGHVAIAFVNTDGSMGIWTSPFTHVPYFYTGYTSVDALARGYGVSYVGWSEDIAGMSVIAPVADAPAPLKYKVVETYDGKLVKLNKQPTYLWGMNWDFDYMVKNPVETHSAGETWTITDKVLHNNGSYYYRRPGQVDGFNVVDCDDYTPPVEIPVPTPVPKPLPPVPTPTPPPVVPTPTPAPAPQPNIPATLSTPLKVAIGAVIALLVALAAWIR